MHFLKLLPFISVTNFLQYLKPKPLRMTLDQSYELLFLSTLAKQIFHENNPFFGQIAEYITSCLLIMQQKGVCKKNHDYQLPMAAYTLHDFALSTIILSLIFGKVAEILWMDQNNLHNLIRFDKILELSYEQGSFEIGC